MGKYFPNKKSDILSDENIFTKITYYSFIALLLLIKKMKFTSFIVFLEEEADFYSDEIDNVKLQNSRDNTKFFFFYVNQKYILIRN